MRPRKYILVMLPLMANLMALGQDTTFHVSVDENPVGLYDAFRITFTLENAEGSNFIAPAFTDFNVLNGSNKSSSITILNGHTSQSSSYSYSLQPRSVGKFTIGSAYIEVNGKNYVSEKIPVEVLDGKLRSKEFLSPNSQGKDTYQSGSGIDTFFRQFMQQSANPNEINDSLKRTISEKPFIKVFIDKNREEVSKKDTITAFFKIYSRYKVIVVGKEKFPSFSGFKCQYMSLSEDGESHQEIKDGKTYYVVDIGKARLKPKKNGKIVLDAMSVKYEDNRIDLSPGKFYVKAYNGETHQCESTPLIFNVSNAKHN